MEMEVNLQNSFKFLYDFQTEATASNCYCDVIMLIWWLEFHLLEILSKNNLREILFRQTAAILSF